MDENKQDPNNDPNGTGNGNSNGNQNGNPTVEDLKNLQKVISEKDRALKDAESKLAEVGKNHGEDREKVKELISNLEKQISGLTDEVSKVNRDKRKQELEKQYPDILPEFLLDKKPEEIDKIVEAQRSKSKQIYGDSQFFQQPTYKDSADIDKAVENTIADKKKTGFESAVDVLRLSRLKGLIR